MNTIRISLQGNIKGQRFLQAYLLDQVTKATLARRLAAQQERVTERQTVLARLQQAA